MKIQHRHWHRHDVLLLWISLGQIVNGLSTTSTTTMSMTSNEARCSMSASSAFRPASCFALPRTTTATASASRRSRLFHGQPLHMTATANVPSSSTRTRPTEQESNDDNDQESATLGAWIPVGCTVTMQGVTPLQMEIMGQKYVVWHNAKTDEWSVMLDACPHRLAPLSQGRIDEETGCIECPYHGWQFTPDGTLQSLPQWDVSTKSNAEKETDASSVANLDLATVRSKNSKLNAKSYPTHRAGNLLFVFLPTSIHGESFPRSLVPEDLYPPHCKQQMLRNGTYYMREVPYSADFLIENFMDPAHIPFAHHGLQGVRQDGTEIPMKLEVMNFTHVEVGFKDVIKGVPRDGIVSFQRPTYYHFRTRPNATSAYRPNLQIHIVPIRAGYSRVIFQNFAPSWIPAWLSHAGSNRFLNTDTWLHDAERMARMQGGINGDGGGGVGVGGGGGEGDGKGLVEDVTELYVTASSSDLGVKHFRTWWKKYGFVSSPPHTFGPASPTHLPTLALTRKQQIDPWMHHTKHCTMCRTALKRWKRVGLGGLGLSLLSTTLLRRVLPLGVGTGLALGGFGLYVVSKRVATFIEGNPSVSGVEDRSVAHLQ